MKFNDIRCEIELAFDKYRKHKYYTLFINDYNTSVTSITDDIGGGRTNRTSDKVADHVIKMISKKEEAIEYVDRIERAVEQLPPTEKELIKLRYMSKNYNYISDYTVYEIEMNPPISRPTYIKIRERAFNSIYNLIVLQKV